MIESTVEKIIELKKSLPDSKDEIVELLPSLASELDLEPKAKSLAISLKLDYTGTEGDEKEEIFQEILDFLETHIKEEKTPSPSEEPDKKKFIKLEKKADTVFKCNSIHKKYSRFHLQDVNLELKRGEITGVVGENSNGKTTLFRVVIGETAPESGTLSYPSWQTNGKKDWLEIKRKIAYVPQELPAWKGNLIQNLYFEASMRGVPKSEIETRVDYIVGRLGLLDYKDRTWSQISGGYKLRFALAKALVWNPSLLVIDEPLAYLDIKAQLIVLNDIRSLAKSLKNPISVLISSQHLREIEKVADNLIYLHKGKVLYNGKVSEFMMEETENVFVMDCDIEPNALKEVFLGKEGITISHNGFEFIIKTPETFGKFHVLDTLVRRRVNVRYFRDITRSIERRFK
ncbi:MAG: ABC transporter ATP-binding protein [Leptospiraceae bacterium]|nr:ABC transporter ATP-binding protein [Leptospiraceae bacterium]